MDQTLGGFGDGHSVFCGRGPIPVSIRWEFYFWSQFSVIFNAMSSTVFRMVLEQTWSCSHYDHDFTGYGLSPVVLFSTNQSLAHITDRITKRFNVGCVLVNGNVIAICYTELNENFKSCFLFYIDDIVCIPHSTPRRRYNFTGYIWSVI